MLYLVPTPIGNLKDITLRAIETLKEVDLILAEDTRTTKRLLDEYDITTPLKAFHLNNEHSQTPRIVEELKEGREMALVSDAGTPGISDPGFLLTREAIKNEIDVQCLPGATAFVPALINSGFPTDRFIYEGFLPHKKGRQKRFLRLAEEDRTIVLYESPHRLIKCLEQIAEFMGKEREISVSRELTKIHEENKRGSVEELIDYFNNEGTIKGEFAIVIKGK